MYFKNQSLLFKYLIVLEFQAAREACNQMGNRKFYEQIIVDSLQVQKGKIVDETDVVTLKDYMQVI